MCLLGNQATKLGAQAFAWLPSDKQVEFYRISRSALEGKKSFCYQNGRAWIPKI